MEEKQLTKPISEEKFRENVEELAMQRHIARVSAFQKDGTLSLRTFEGVGRFRSIRRAIKRGHVSLYGDVYPNRPFSNRKRNKGTATYDRRMVHEQLRTHTTD